MKNKMQNICGNIPVIWQKMMNYYDLFKTLRSIDDGWTDTLTKLAIGPKTQKTEKGKAIPNKCTKFKYLLRENSWSGKVHLRSLPVL